MVALGSCGELESQLEIGAALGDVSPKALTGFLEKLDHENRMLRKLYSKLGEDRPGSPKSPVTKAAATAPIEY